MNIAKISLPTRSDLVKEFGTVSRLSYKGVRGIWCISSGLKGPTVGITVHTHGNEPSGLAAVWYMRSKFHLWEKLRCGRVLFVLNNISATRRYFEARTKLERLHARFVAVNMNRLPTNLPELAKDRRYEIRRAKTLLPVWREFSLAMDIHSTAKQSPPMMIQVERGERIKRLTRDFPIETVISGIARYQLRRPAIAFYGDPSRRIPAIGIEVGSHENKRAFAVAIACVKAFLGAAGVIENTSVRRKAPHSRRYVVGGSVVFPDKSWKLTKVFRTFEQVRKGRVLAVGSGNRKIRAPFTGVTLFGPPRKRAVKLEDEVLFLARTRGG